MTIFETLQTIPRHDLVSGWAGGDLVPSRQGDWVNLDALCDMLVDEGIISREQATSLWL